MKKKTGFVLSSVAKLWWSMWQRNVMFVVVCEFADDKSHVGTAVSLREISDWYMLSIY